MVRLNEVTLPAIGLEKGQLDRRYYSEDVTTWKKITNRVSLSSPYTEHIPG